MKPYTDLQTKLRSQPDENHPGSNRGWEIIYTGFIMIMLSFFIMLTSFASMDKARVMQFSRAFTDAVSVKTGGLNFEPGDTVLTEPEDMVHKESELAYIFKDVVQYVSTMGIGAEIGVAFSEKGLVMTLDDKLLFETGVAEISNTAMPLLSKIGHIISETKHGVQIEGHTDNVPIQTRRYPSNWELSTARAVNVLRFFISNNDISPERLYAVGFGEFQPVTPNATKEGREKNRRVEIIFLRSEEFSENGSK